MSQQIINAVQKSQLKTDLPPIKIGDTVDVHVRIIEGAKERIQIFSGVVIALKGGGLDRTITVRRIVANEGVERIFPVNSPRIAKFVVTRSAHVRRAKLYYLRDRVGKSRRLRDAKRGLEGAIAAEPAAPAAAEPAAAASAPAAEAPKKETKPKA